MLVSRSSTEARFEVQLLSTLPREISGQYLCGCFAIWFFCRLCSQAPLWAQLNAYTCIHARNAAMNDSESSTMVHASTFSRLVGGPMYGWIGEEVLGSKKYAP